MSGGRRKLISLAVVLLLASCTSNADSAADDSGGNDKAAVTSVDVATLKISDPVDVAEHDPNSFNHTSRGGGGWAAYDVSTKELCAFRVEAGSSTRSCVELNSVETFVSGSWAADGKQLLVTNDFTRRFRDPDVSIVDFEQGTVDVLTEDGTDEYSDERAATDIAPFFGPHGNVHFFSTSFDTDAARLTTEINMLGADRAITSLDIDVPDVNPRTNLFDLGGGRFAFTGDVFINDDVQWSRLFVLDLSAGTLEEEVIPPFEQTFLLTASAGVIVVIDVEATTRGFAPIEMVVIDVDTGKRTVITQDDLESVSPIDNEGRPIGRPLAAISPDGASLLVGIVGGPAGQVPVFAFERDEQGRFVNSRLVTADLTPNAERREDSIAGFRSTRMIWTDDNTLLAPTFDERVLSFDLTSG